MLVEIDIKSIRYLLFRITRIKRDIEDVERNWTQVLKKVALEPTTVKVVLNDVFVRHVQQQTDVNVASIHNAHELYEETFEKRPTISELAEYIKSEEFGVMVPQLANKNNVQYDDKIVTFFHAVSRKIDYNLLAVQRAYEDSGLRAFEEAPLMEYLLENRNKYLGQTRKDKL